MNCRGVSRRLSAFIDGYLSPAIKQSVEEHLKVCARCRRKLAETEAIVKVAHELPSLKVSEGFADRLVSAVYSKSGTEEVFGKIRYKFAMASAAFMIAAAAVFFLAGPPAFEVNRSLTDKEIESIHELPGQPGTQNFVADPRVTVWSVPVPSDIVERERLLDDSLLLADTASKIDNFILPEVEGGMKVNKQF